MPDDPPVDRTGADGTGTQAVQRALRLLGLVAEHRYVGIRLTELARLTSLHVATAHRLLGALVREGMVSLDGYAKRYYLGPRLIDLGQVAQMKDLESWKAAAVSLARSTEDVVYVYAPVGQDVVCVHRVEGAYPVKALIREVGARIPMGANSGSIHMLALMPADQARDTIAANASRYPSYGGLTADEVRQAVDAARISGYGLNDGKVLRGVTGVGVAIADPAGTVRAAISVVAVSHRLEGPRRDSVVRQIRKALDGETGPASRTSARRS
ncbi:MAG: IclR family transcriptional regulator [Burkholderiaceae bacterium]